MGIKLEMFNNEPGLPFGEPFGEMALVDKASRIATAVAKTPVKLAVIGEKRFLFLVEQTPYFALQVMKVMSDRLRRMNDLRVSSAAATL